ncbi:UDP-glycosyltransferase 74E2-like [Neltuma alba]|uniref:UDP-glycosyltransferase 74E2-like n=1 Tax=Neltuma alba TaxID=207710 RepID=UPI0010A4A959|nr:UDP-glycosyltransferase 74E2-like [Prosopis alba]
MKMEMEIQLPGMPLLEPKDLSSLVFAHQTHPDLFDVLLAQFSNIDEVDWILCNTFYELEKEVADWLKTIWPKLRAVGPTVPSMLPDKRLKEDEDYGFNLCKNEDCCLKWLDDKPKGSVVYVSFGSMSNIKENQMQELAWGLKHRGYFFLWVVREYEESKLPKDFEKRSEKGLVVSWCPQLKVLSHESVGCFLTHSGWNSTLEALCAGVPMVAVPQWTDQSLNAKNVRDVWKMGMRAEAGEDGIVKRETLKNCIKEVMESEIGKEMKRNAIPWKVSASEAIDEGGSSQKQIREFVESHKKVMEMDKTDDESSRVTNRIVLSACP